MGSPVPAVGTNGPAGRGSAVKKTVLASIATNGGAGFKLSFAHYHRFWAPPGLRDASFGRIWSTLPSVATMVIVRGGFPSRALYSNAVPKMNIHWKILYII